MSGILGGLLGGAGSLIGGMMQSSAQKDIAKQQMAMAQQSLDFTKQVYGTTTQQMQPFLNTGQNAMAQLGQAFSGNPGSSDSYWKNAMASSPFFSGMQKNVMDATKAASVGTMGEGGNTLNALYQANYGLYNQTATDYTKNLMNIAGMGEQAGSVISGAGSNAANTVGNVTNSASANYGNTMNQAAQATGGGVMGALGSVGNYFNTQYLLSQLNNGNSGSNGFGGA